MAAASDSAWDAVRVKKSERGRHERPKRENKAVAHCATQQEASSSTGPAIVRLLASLAAQGLECD